MFIGVAENAKPGNREGFGIVRVMGLDGGRYGMALRADLGARNFSPPNGVAKDLPSTFRNCAKVFFSKSKAQVTKFRIGFSRFLAAIFSKRRVGSEAGLPSRSFGRVAGFFILGVFPPCRGVGDRFFPMSGVIRLSSGLRFFGVGVWHDRIVPRSLLNVNTGWTP
jgi:hypothetical protein